MAVATQRRYELLSVTDLISFFSHEMSSVSRSSSRFSDVLSVHLYCQAIFVLLLALYFSHIMALLISFLAFFFLLQTTFILFLKLWT